MAALQDEPSHGFLAGPMRFSVPQKPPKAGPLYAPILSFTHKEGRA